MSYLKGVHMKESITIPLPRTMPLVTRISETSRRIKEWLQSLASGYNDENDKLQLKKWELDHKEFRYYYSIISRKELSASDVNNRRESHLPNAPGPDSEDYVGI
jgi:hypothetical protein